jgi:methyl-accepting chemotaxis protein
MDAAGDRLAKLVADAAARSSGSDRAALHAKASDSAGRMAAGGKGVKAALIDNVALEKLTEYAADIEAGQKAIAESYGRLAQELEREIATADANLTAALGRSIGFAAASAVIATLVTIGLGILLFRSLVLPLRAMAAAMRRLASGDTSIVVTGAEVQDEMGEMARALGVFKQNIAEVATLREREIETARKTEEERRTRTLQLIEQILDTLKRIHEKSLDAVVRLEKTSVTMGETADNGSNQTHSAAQSAEATSGNVATVAAAAEELSASIGEITRQVKSSTEIAEAAAQQAHHVTRTITELKASSENIGAISNLIRDIASQTNLLALNATIEAARAGDAGKGFAVVASEVKNLANATTKATEDIGTQIEMVQGAIKGTTDEIMSLVHEIEQMRQIAVVVQQSIQEQSQATTGIANNVAVASTSVVDLARNVQSLDATIADLKDLSHTVADASSLVREQSELVMTEVVRQLRATYNS